MGVNDDAVAAGNGAVQERVPRGDGNAVVPAFENEADVREALCYVAKASLMMTQVVGAGKVGGEGVGEGHARGEGRRNARRCGGHRDKRTTNELRRRRSQKNFAGNRNIANIERAVSSYSSLFRVESVHSARCEQIVPKSRCDAWWTGVLEISCQSLDACAREPIQGPTVHLLLL